MSAEVRPAIAHVKATHIGPEGKLIDGTREAQQLQPKPERPGWLGGFLGILRKKELPKQPEGPKHVFEALQEAGLIVRAKDAENKFFETAKADTEDDGGINDYFNLEQGSVDLAEIEKRIAQRGGENAPFVEVPKQVSEILRRINTAAIAKADAGDLAQVKEDSVKSLSYMRLGEMRVVTKNGIRIYLRFPQGSDDSQSGTGKFNHLSFIVDASYLSDKNPGSSTQIGQAIKKIQEDYDNPEKLLEVSEELVGYVEKVVGKLPQESEVRKVERRQEKEHRRQEIERIARKNEELIARYQANHAISVGLGKTEDYEGDEEEYEGEQKPAGSQEGLDKKFEVLSERDQKLLDSSLRSIMQEIIKQYPDELPDAVILPDTSGRPLAYLLRPIFAAIAEKRGIKNLPELIFFKTQNNDDTYSEALEPSIITFEEVEGITDGEPAQANETRLTSEDTNVEARAVHAKRAEVIKEHLKRKLNGREPKVIIVDDSVRDEYTTTKSIRNAFGTKDIPAFALLAKQKSVGKGDKISVGIVPKQELDDLKSIGTLFGSFAGFDYRRQQMASIEEPKKHTSHIGVTKIGQDQELYVRKASNTSAEEMRKLRHDMALIGERIAQDILQGLPD